MGGIEKHAAFYRAYLADDRSRTPLTIALVTGIAVWLLVYLVGVVGPAPSAERALARHNAAAASGFHAAAGALGPR